MPPQKKGVESAEREGKMGGGGTKRESGEKNRPTDQRMQSPFTHINTLLRTSQRDYVHYLSSKEFPPLHLLKILVFKEKLVAFFHFHSEKEREEGKLGASAPVGGASSRGEEKRGRRQQL